MKRRYQIDRERAVQKFQKQAKHSEERASLFPTEIHALRHHWRTTLAARGGSPRTRKKGTASQFPFDEALILKWIGEAEIGGSPSFSPEDTFATGC